MTQSFRYPHLVSLVIFGMIAGVSGILPAVKAQIRPETAVFSRNLTIGMKGEDVRWLQRLLNSDWETRVADTGAGSPGQETDYFGFLTRGAVRKFQNKYKNDILIPVGLFSGTGFAGPRTIIKLNQLFFEPARSSSALRGEGGPSATLPVKTEIAVKPRIDRIDPESGSEGAVIKIYGEGFTDNNTLHNIFDSVYNFPSLDGKIIVWKFEESKAALNDFDIYQYFDKDDSGKYKIASAEEIERLKASLKNISQEVLFYIENENGSSNKIIFNRIF